jgi:hypothetical protein
VVGDLIGTGSAQERIALADNARALEDAREIGHAAPLAASGFAKFKESSA